MEWPVSDERGMGRDHGVHLGRGVTMAVLFLHESWLGAAFGGGCDLWPAVLTVPLTFFCKRHGRGRLLHCGFDRAFDAFL